MVRDPERDAFQQKRQAPKLHESQQHRSGEGAASALASMKKQVRQLRREAGKPDEDRKTGGGS
jgi:hypothetical protein